MNQVDKIKLDYLIGVKNDIKEKNQFRENLIKQGYFKPKHFGNPSIFYITKYFLIKILFPNLTIKKHQKILSQAKKRNTWNMQNNLFRLKKNVIFYTCKKGCTHEFGFGYCQNQMYFQDVLVLEIDNIHDQFKIKDPDPTNNFYWIKPETFISLFYLFE